MAKTTTLYAPDGREYRTSDRAEVTRLKARGYTEAPKAKAPPPKDPPPSKTS